MPPCTNVDTRVWSLRVVREILELRRLAFCFIALADDNFDPVTFEALAQARHRIDPSRLI